MDYILETVRWLCNIQNKDDGGWGIYPGDNSHQPITGEVALSLASVPFKIREIDDSLNLARQFFSQSLDAAADIDTVKSTVHLCWLVLGSLSCRIEITDDRLLALLEKLIESQLQGWSWKLKDHGATVDDSAIYPTYLACWTLSKAKQAGWDEEPDIGHTVAWLLSLRSSDDLLWGHDNMHQGMRAVLSSYALLAIHYSGITINDEFANLAGSLQSLSKATLSLKSTEVVALEVGRGRNNNPIPWHHCVLQQVALSYLLILDDIEMVREVIPRLFNRFFSCMEGKNGSWNDPLRKCEAPCVGADSLFAMALWSTAIEEHRMAPAIAVQLGTALDQVDDSQERLMEEPYQYQWRHVGMSKTAYFTLAIMCILTTIGLSVAKNVALDMKWGLRILAIYLTIMLYKPIAEWQKYKTKEKILLALALCSLASLLIMLFEFFIPGILSPPAPPPN
jgi:hypothetical protein